MVGGDAERRFKISLDEDERDDCSCNYDAFDAFGFHGIKR
jgi:hypothetical protein